MQIEEHVPLAPLTTFNIGGPARFFVRIKNVKDLQESFNRAADGGLKTCVLGGGSNVLVDDSGFDGLVIKVEIFGVQEKGNSIVASAGENWDSLVARAVQKNLWGIENLSGIPGTVGGAVVQNIGAYGQALSQTLSWVEVLDRQDMRVKTLNYRECAFGYRSSVFKEQDGRYVILRAEFGLSTAEKPNLSYADLKKVDLRSPTLGELRSAVLVIRAKKFPDIRQEGSAGSFFKNPILSAADAGELQARYPKMPLFAMLETSGMKVPLAWILDHALGLRGLRMGRARLFEHQPLVIVAEKDTTAAEVRKLAAHVQEKIRNVLHREIEPEVKIL